MGLNLFHSFHEQRPSKTKTSSVTPFFLMLPQGSPIQYYVPPGGQPAVQQPQQVQMLQPVQGQGVPVPPQPRQDPEMAPITINKAY